MKEEKEYRTKLVPVSTYNNTEYLRTHFPLPLLKKLGLKKGDLLHWKLVQQSDDVFIKVTF
jgi:hypothetical protein